MKTTTESSAATASLTDDQLAQVIPFPEWAIKRRSPQAIQYEQTKEHEERIARIRDKIHHINRMIRERSENG